MSLGKIFESFDLTGFFRNDLHLPVYKLRIFVTASDNLLLRLMAPSLECYGFILINDGVAPQHSQERTLSLLSDEQVVL